MGFEQALLQELLLYLLDLDRLHLAAVGGKFAVGLRAQGGELVLGRRGEQCGEELFFEHGEGLRSEFFKLGSSRRLPR